MSSLTPPRTLTHRIDAIQCLRAAAALLVVIDHSLLSYISGPGAGLHIRIHDTTRAAEAIGRFGVEIFFLISGFIMANTMYHRFGTKGASLDFIWKRLIRIIPLYWLVTLVTIVMRTHAGDAPTASQIIHSLLFIPYGDETGVFQPILRRGWTLNYEMFFYVLLAVSLTQTRVRGIAITATALAALALAAPAVPNAACGAWCGLAWFYGQPIVLFFLGGIAVALLRHWLIAHNKLPKVSVEAAIVAAIILIVAYSLILQADIGRQLLGVLNATLAILATCCCALIAETGRANPLRSTMLLLGDASYSLYLVHAFVIEPIAQVWMQLIGRHAAVAFLLCMATAASLAAIATYKLIERPSLEWLRQATHRKPSVAE